MVRWGLEREIAMNSKSLACFNPKVETSPTSALVWSERPWFHCGRQNSLKVYRFLVYRGFMGPLSSGMYGFNLKVEGWGLCKNIRVAEDVEGSVPAMEGWSVGCCTRRI